MYRTIWLNAFFLLDGTCNSVVELSNSTGWDFDSTIKFNASMGEEHCEWFVCGVCGTEVAFDIKQVGFTVSSLFSPRPASYSRMEVILATLHCCWMQWEKKLSHEVGQDRNCSHNRAAKHMKISCLSRKSSLNYSWCSWILPQAIRDIHLSCPWFLAELDYCSKSINISTCIDKHPGMPGYKKHNRLRMSSILHPPDFASFSLL